VKRVLGSFFLFTSLFVCLADASVIDVQLTNSSLTGAPGDTLIFYATLTNPSSTDTIYLNGAGSTASSPFLNIDTSPFDANAPLFLAPGATSGPFELFDVLIDPAATDGPYTGSFVTILGGADAGAFDDLADISFDVNVSSSQASVPEPGTIPLVAAALLALLPAAMARRVRSR
jgi:hypothetical protein